MQFQVISSYFLVRLCKWTSATAFSPVQTLKICPKPENSLFLEFDELTRQQYTIFAVQDFKIMRIMAYFFLRSDFYSLQRKIIVEMSYY